MFGGAPPEHGYRKDAIGGDRDVQEEQSRIPDTLDTW